MSIASIVDRSFIHPYWYCPTKFGVFVNPSCKIEDSMHDSTHYLAVLSPGNFYKVYCLIFCVLYFLPSIPVK